MLNNDAKLAQQRESMGNRIRVLREARGMTQSELAQLCGVTKSAVCQWETGATENIKLQPFLALVKALETRFDYLVFGAKR